VSVTFTLPHQVELLSDRWLEKAQRYIQSELDAPRMPGTPPVGPFSVTERFTDPPPHLGLGDRATWSARWDGAQLAVSRESLEDADVTVDGDYQAAVTASQFVGIGDPRLAARMHGEVALRYGADALRVRGRITDPAAGALLGRLHDHMGRITTENPDLQHRAARQGLLGHIQEMEEQGYTVIERAITDDFADELREATDRVLKDHGTTSLQWMLYHGRPFELLAQNAPLLTIMDASLGRGAVIASLSAIRRGPGKGFIPLHTDYSHVPEPYPDFALTGVGVWALEDWTEASGPTWLVPGSHKRRRPPRPGESVDDAVPIEMPKGSVVFFTEGVWHWQGDRTDEGERITLHWHYNRGILRSLEPKKVDPQMLHRNSPRLGEMLGEDDWFDKMAGIGRDHVRFAHMQRLHAFNDGQKRKILEDAGVAVPV
jgi:hypothetical protein